MISILLAALIGAAQEDFVVIEGAKTSHFVENHEGSYYSWNVFVDFNPETEANQNEFEFLTSSESSEIEIQWNAPGSYYISVTETNVDGCTNQKVLPVNVVPNGLTLGFIETTGSACYNTKYNGFNLPLQFLDNNGEMLNAEHFPIKVEFLVNQNRYEQLVQFENQNLLVENSYLTFVSPESDNNIEIVIESAFDNNSLPIFPIANRNSHSRIIYAVPVVDFIYVDDIVDETSIGSYSVEMRKGVAQNAIYQWGVDPSNGTGANLKSIEDNEAEIFWSGLPGLYNLNVFVIDGNGCYSDTITKSIDVQRLITFNVDAGPDTVIGSCNPYIFTHTSPVYENYTYSWTPAISLDDANSPNPTFTPGETTNFVLTVTSPQGIVEKDTVTIEVAEVFANAGDDLYMELGSTVLLNATQSIGYDLAYEWTTQNGTIESGANSPNPVVSDFGTYYLEVTDRFNCTSIDSVSVYRLAHAPVAANDYDTTNYMTEVIIPVLDNDSDVQNALDSASLSITSSPLYGTAYVDYEDFTVHYRPEKGFIGNDNFEYIICNTFDKCSNANVFVLVSGFEFMVPDAFSPNDDGINDVFEIVGIEHYEGNSITIINRSGIKVFEAKNYGISSDPVFWDGKANTGTRIGDEELSTGTYFYILDLGIGEKPISGSIYLDR